jgi:hypothetical protein
MVATFTIGIGWSTMVGFRQPTINPFWAHHWVASTWPTQLS